METKYSLISQPYRILADAIILQAVNDYRKARKKLLEKDKDVEALRDYLDVEMFFRSSWFQVLTFIDGDYILRKLHEE